MLIHPNQRAPMLWCLLPWIGGILLENRLGPYSGPLIAGIALATLAMAASAFLLKEGWQFRVAWGIGMCLFWISVSMMNVKMQKREVPVWDSDYPPREAILTLKVESVAGVGDRGGDAFLRLEARVMDSHLPTLNAQDFDEILVFVRRSEEHPGIFPGSLLLVKGVMRFPTHRYRLPVLNQAVVQSVKTGKPSIVHIVRHKIIGRLLASLEQGASGRHSYPNYMKSMLTGDKRFLSWRERTRFGSVGVMHFFAVSGFHLGILTAVVLLTTRIMGLPRWWMHGIAAMVCAGYVWLTGFPVSGLRAFLMLALFLSASGVRRRANPLAAVIASAWILLLFDPLYLEQAGFQLSFLVVIAILRHAVPLQQWMVRSRADPLRIPEPPTTKTNLLRDAGQYAAGLFAVSWTAFWVSAPVVGYHFGTVPFAGIVLNTVLAPLFALCMVAGILSLAFGFPGVFLLSSLFNHASWLLLHMISHCIQLGHSVSWLAVPVQQNALIATMTVSLMLAVMLVPNHSKTGSIWSFVALPVLSMSSILLLL